MYSTPHSQEIATHLAGLAKEPFEEAVTVLLARTMPGFQEIPKHPSGDGGLDGLSHGQTRAYCCYGLEQDALRHKKGTEIKNAISKKFRGDMLRIFELEHEGKTKLKKAPNSQLASIHAGTNPIDHIYLIANWFRSHQLIGTLQKARDRFAKASDCRFVSPDCELVILGPEELCKRTHPEAALLAELQVPELLTLLRTPPNGENPAEVSNFDEKFDALMDEVGPARQDAVQRLRKGYLKDWVAYMQSMRKLDAEMPHVHAQLEEVRLVAVRKADELCLLASPSDAQRLISELEDRISVDLKQALPGRVPKKEIDQFTTRMIASLLGECPLDWRPRE